MEHGDNRQWRRDHCRHDRRHGEKAFPRVHAQSARLPPEGQASQALRSVTVWSVPQGELVQVARVSFDTHLNATSQVLGLSIDEAITFWRRSFSNLQDDKFNKEYRYNIRHSYGLEGKRANYPAKRFVYSRRVVLFVLTLRHSCQQILTADQPGTGDSHGCPYRHFSPDNLQTALLSMYSSQGLTAGDLPEIMHAVKSNHFHVACTRVFEITHARQGVAKGEGVGGGESVTHPNQYAARSRELEREKEGVKKEEDGDVAMMMG